MNKKHFNKSRKNWFNSLTFNVSNVKKDPYVLLEVAWYTQQPPKTVQEFLGRYHGGKLLINTDIQSFSHVLGSENDCLSFFRQFFSALLSEAQLESLDDLYGYLQKSTKHYLRTAFSKLVENPFFLEYYTDNEDEILYNEDSDIITGEFYDFLNIHPKSLSWLIGEILDSLGASWLEGEGETLSQPKSEYKTTAQNPSTINIYQGAQEMSYGIFDSFVVSKTHEEIKKRLEEIQPGDLSIKEKESLVDTVYQHMADEAECENVLTGTKEQAITNILTFSQRKDDKIKAFVSSVVNIYRQHLEEAQQSKSGIIGITSKNKNYTSASAINSKEENSHWNRYRNYLINEYVNQGRWTSDSLESLDAASTSVLLRLGRPTPENKFDVKGLVLGYVQSGKTANIMAVVAKAADAGYKYIIVLSGRTEVLRAQTQSRLIRELEITNGNNRWHVINGDNQNRGLNYTDCVKIGVYLKTGNVRRNGQYGGSLGGVYEYLNGREDVLIIDDECDTATPNGLAAEADAERTICNRIINEILKWHQRISYIGYSATPFANMLMDPNDLDDVYLKDFILSLPKPGGNYIGSDDIFYQQLKANSEFFEVKNRFDVLKDLDDCEANTISGGPRNTRPLPSDPREYPGLQQATFHFLMALLLRKKRTAMIVNPARANGIHDQVAALLEKMFKDIEKKTDEELQDAVNKWKSTETSVNASAAKTALSPGNIRNAIKKSVAICLMNQDGNAGINDEGHNTFSTTYGDGKRNGVVFVGGEMLSRGVTFDGLVVTYFARSSKNYSTLIQMGRWLGYRRPDMDLCRVWMTKEKQEAYLEFTKIEQEIRDMIKIHYHDQGIEPCDLPTYIRQVPGYEIIRPEQLGRHVQMHAFDFSGDNAQTIYFHDDRYDWEKDNDFNHKLESLKNSTSQWASAEADRLKDTAEAAKKSAEGYIKSNWNLAEKFFDDHKIEMAADNQSLLVKDVSIEDVLSILNNYHFHPKQTANNTHVSGMIRYIEQNKKKHARWNVVLRSLSTGKEEQKCIIAGKTVYMTERSREEIYKDVIKTGDLLVDLHSLLDFNPSVYKQAMDKYFEIQRQNQKECSDEEKKKNSAKMAQMIDDARKNKLPDTSLLVFYPIYKDSKAPATAKYRKNLNQKSNLMGLAVVLSGEKEDGWGWLQARGRVQEKEA